MRNETLKICFLADSHSLYDDRIYWKEALSLQKHGYKIHYILAGDTNESGITKEGIHFYFVQRNIYHPNRFFNFLIGKMMPGSLYSNMLQRAAAIGAAVYHIHDLRINSIGNQLKNLPQKPKVIYDVHEPYPENVIDYYTGPSLLKPLIRLYSQYIRSWEKRHTAAYDTIITTEENMQERFRSYFPGKPVEIIYNYTNLPDDGYSSEVSGKYDAIYTGGITERRGAMKILEAVKIVSEKHPKFRMLFLGSWFPSELKGSMQRYADSNGISENLEMHEAVPFNEVTRFYRQSRIGLGIFLPIPTHRIILQIKIFEYMNFGLPIVGSNFGHIAHIIQKHECGIQVDPEDPESIARALDKLISDENLHRKMSQQARDAARKFYRWDLMEDKLISLYQKIAG